MPSIRKGNKRAKRVQRRKSCGWRMYADFVQSQAALHSNPHSLKVFQNFVGSGMDGPNGSVWSYPTPNAEALRWADI
jgi:hypothetical protein